MSKKTLKSVLIAAAIFSVSDLFCYFAFFEASAFGGLGTICSILQMLSFLASFFMIKAIFSKVREKKQRRYYIPLLCYFMYMIYFIFNAFNACSFIVYMNGYDSFSFYKCYLRLAEMSLAIIILLERIQSKANKKAKASCIVIIVINLFLMMVNTSVSQLAVQKKSSFVAMFILIAFALISHIYTAKQNCKVETKGTFKGTIAFVGVTACLFFGTVGGFFFYHQEDIETSSYSFADVTKSADENSKANTYINSGITDDSLTDRINQYLTANENKFSGSITIQVQDQILYEKAFGLADQKNNREYTTNEVFPIISSTGQFVAASIYQLEEAGKLNTNDTVDHYIPEFEQGNQIKISDLLYHTSGLESYERIYYSQQAIISELYGMDDFKLSYSFPMNREFITLLNGYSLIAEPGTEYNTCKTDNYLLGLIVERVAGQSYKDYIKQHILEPLGLHNTYFNGKQITTNGYYKDKVYNRTPNESFNYCSTGMCSTIDDMLTWQEALMSGKVITEQSLQKLLETNPVTEHAQGWEILEHGYRAYTGDSGNVLMQYYDPEHKISIIAVQNKNAGEATNCIYDLEETLSNYYEQEDNN